MTTSRASAEVPVGEPAEPTSAGRPDGERDGLEHWLDELRTDLSNDPPGWLDSSAARDLPLRADDSDDGDGHVRYQAGNAGRHRAPD